MSRTPHVVPFRHSTGTVLLLSVVLLQLLTEVASRPRYGAPSKRYRELSSGTGNSVADEDPLTVAASTSLAQSAAPSHHHGGRTHQQPASWRQGRCIDDAAYSWCFMCGKVVESRDIYFGCCRAEKRVMTFCEQLLS